MQMSAGRARRRVVPPRAGAALGVPARPDAPVDGAGRGRGQDRASSSSSRCGCGASSASSASRTSRSRRRRRRQLALRNWSEELRLVDNVDPARRPALHQHPDRGAGQPDPLRQVRRELPEEGRRRRPLHREAAAPVDARGRPHPAARVLRGLPPPPHGPDAPLAHPLRDLRGGGQGPLPRGAAQPPPGAAHRQEVQADPRPDHATRPSPPTIRRIPDPRQRQAGGQGVPGVLPAAPLPRVRRPRAEPTRTT